MTTPATTPTTAATTAAVAPVTQRHLPTEFNPVTFPPSARTARCMQLVPILDAYNKLDKCYSDGGDIQDCESKIAYADTYAEYQKCVSGIDPPVATTTTGAVAPTTSTDTSSLNKSFVYILLAVTAIGSLCSMIVLFLLFRRQS